jgi:hypothetical protein
VAAPSRFQSSAPPPKPICSMPKQSHLAIPPEKDRLDLTLVLEPIGQHADELRLLPLLTRQQSARERETFVVRERHGDCHGQGLSIALDWPGLGGDIRESASFANSSAHWRPRSVNPPSANAFRCQAIRLTSQTLF